MPEIADVVTLTTISSDWGNDIRDRTIQRYASVAARTAAHPSPTEGDLSYLNDANQVYLYDGSAWVAMSGTGAVRAGGAQDLSSSALTGTMTDKASVVFTKPADWATYELVAWGSMQTSSAPSGAANARVEIGASNGTTNNRGIAGQTVTLACFHSVTAQSTSPVTVNIAANVPAGASSHEASTIQYIAYRLT